MENAADELFNPGEIDALLACLSPQNRRLVAAGFVDLLAAVEDFQRRGAWGQADLQLVIRRGEIHKSEVTMMRTRRMVVTRGSGLPTGGRVRR